MELYFVIAKVIAGTRNKFEDYRILKLDAATPVDQQVPAEFEKRRGPASLDECVEFIKEVTDSSGKFVNLTYLQYILIFVVTLSFVVVILNGAVRVTYDQDDSARNLITFLVAVGTIAIAFLAILTAMVIREFKERFALAKEVLTILVGVLGTIVGFYFGTAGKDNANRNANVNTNVNANVNVNTNVNTAAKTNSTPNTNTNANANANANSKTNTSSNVGVNSSARVLRLPSGKTILVNHKQDGTSELSRGA